MAKSPTANNIEKALGISDDLTKLNVASEDSDKKKQFEDRQQKLAETKNEFIRKRATYEQDKDFIKEMYKELAETAMIAVRIMQEEAGVTGDYKNVEALAAAANAVAGALSGLKDVEHDEEKLRIEREKVEIKKNSTPRAPGISTTGTTNVFVGTTADLIKELKKSNMEDLKNIEGTVNKDEIIDSGDK